MSTYDNCYSLLEDVRRGLDEYSTLLMQGLDTSGKYKNSYVVSKLNTSQRYLYSFLLQRLPEAFLQSASITGVSSVYTLPWDFGVIREFRDGDGNKVHPIGVSQIKTSTSVGSASQYYRKGNTLVLNKDGITDTYTLWYYRACRDITQGKASDGGLASITLATTAKKIADYYNGMTIENITSDWTDEITDYSAARVATIVETAAANDYYGIVSSLPEDFHSLIAPGALISIRILLPANERPSGQEIEYYREMLLETTRSFAGSSLDVAPESIWCDWVGGPGGVGVNIPGQGYLI